MQTAVRLIGIATETPSVAPENNAPQIPLICDLTGMLYTKLTIADNIVIQGQGNDSNKSPSSSPINIPTISYTYVLDDVSGDFLRLKLYSNVDNIDADTTFGSALPVASFPYVYSGQLDQLAVVIGRGAASSMFIDDQDINPPTVSFAFMRGEHSNGSNLQTPLRAMGADRVGELGVALTVVEQLDSPVHDAPVAATQAQVAIAGSNGAPVKISAIGFSLTAIAAQATPVLVELVEDTGGTPVVIWSTQVVAPAGGYVNVMMPVNMLANVDATLTVAAPAATNFVTATLVGNGTIGNGSPEPPP